MLKKGDIILVAVLSVIIAVSFGAMMLYKGAADNGAKIAVIRQDDREIRRIDLDTVTEPYTLEVYGKYTNMILIEKGRIRFKDATCPDKVCVKTGWLTNKGDMAVCLPNRIIIKIEGDNKKIDGATY